MVADQEERTGFPHLQAAVVHDGSTRRRTVELPEESAIRFHGSRQRGRDDQSGRGHVCLRSEIESRGIHQDQKAVGVDPSENLRGLSVVDLVEDHRPWRRLVKTHRLPRVEVEGLPLEEGILRNGDVPMGSADGGCRGAGLDRQSGGSGGLQSAMEAQRHRHADCPCDPASGSVGGEVRESIVHQNCPPTERLARGSPRWLLALSIRGQPTVTLRSRVLFKLAETPNPALHKSRRLTNASRVIG